MRLIDADAILEKMRQTLEMQELYLPIHFIDFIIDEMPTIEECKTGRWLETDDGYDGIYYECSVCGEPWTLIEGTPKDNNMNYCPNCGASMDEESKEEERVWSKKS